MIPTNTFLSYQVIEEHLVLEVPLESGVVRVFLERREPQWLVLPEKRDPRECLGPLGGMGRREMLELVAEMGRLVSCACLSFVNVYNQFR